MGLRVEHMELREANAFVTRLHRHHKKVTGHRFSLGAVDVAKDGTERLVGVAIVGRPVARGCSHRNTLEVTRLCTDGHKNACSFLYAACARAGRELGYEKIQTYVLVSEPAVTLRASGWVFEAETSGGHWKHSSGPRNNDHPAEKKQRWAKMLRG